MLLENSVLAVNSVFAANSVLAVNAVGLIVDPTHPAVPSSSNIYICLRHVSKIRLPDFLHPNYPFRVMDCCEQSSPAIRAHPSPRLAFNMGSNHMGSKRLSKMRMLQLG